MQKTSLKRWAEKSEHMHGNSWRRHDGVASRSAISAICFFFMVAGFVLPAEAQQVSIWSASATPGNITASTSSAVELGLKFQSSVIGNVTGVRFYKGPSNTGTHIGHLWSSAGALLATVTFANETASGWQQANFSTPVAIQANTTYIVSYYCPNGHYSYDQNYFASATTNAPLTALQNSSASPNGVYVWGSSAFPNQTWNASNYWVDLAFVPAAATSSIWSPTAVPQTVTDPDSSAIEVGVKFHSSVAGNVTGVRFYKGPSNTGTHIGHLWTGAGALLATVTFANETASGWQQAKFSTPVAIQANTTYVVSYYCPNGHYPDDENYFTSATTNAPLTALRDGAADPNGVYIYGSSAFPNQGWNASNYWVDLLFVTAGSSGGSTGSYSISGTVNGSPATLALSGASTGSTTTNASGSYSFSALPNGSYVVTPGQSGYSFTPSTASISINGANVSGVSFTATADPVNVQHSVALSWTASTSSNIVGYNVYRSTTSGGPYTSIQSSVLGTSYTDATVSSGTTYYYVTAAVDTSNNEGGYSNQAVAAVPVP